MTSGRTTGILLLAWLVCWGSACNRHEAAPGSSSASSAPPADAHAHAHDHGPAAQATSGSRAPELRYDGPLPPIPTVSFVPPRSPDVVKATYEFAGRRPDVLQYVPCFCMCERSGHVGNDDCFVKSRDASGKPSWDLHGMG